MRKIVFIGVIAACAILWAVWFFVRPPSLQSSRENSAFRAIPVKTPVIVEITDVQALLNISGENSPMIEALQTIPGLQSLTDDINGLEHYIEENAELKRMLDRRQILLAFNQFGKNEIGILVAININPENSEIMPFVREYAQRLKVELPSRRYGNTELCCMQIDKDKLYFAEKNGVFLLSRHYLLIEEALRQLNTDNLLDDRQFKDLYKTVSKGSDLNIFINHSKVSELLEKAVMRSFLPEVRRFGKFADWTELDITLKDSEVMLNGFSFSNEQGSTWTSVFRRQQPGRFGMAKMLPSSVSLFVNMNLSDYNAFIDDYSEFLGKEHRDRYFRRETYLKKMESDYGRPFLAPFREIAGKEFAIAFWQVLKNEITANRLFIAEVKSPSAAREQFLTMLNEYARLKNRSLSDMTTEWTSGNKKSTMIYEFPHDSLPYILGGDTYAAVKSNYMCFYDNYIVFADNLPILKEYLKCIELQDTMDKDPNFQKFSQGVSSKSVFYCYVDIPKAFPLHDSYLSVNLSKAVLDGEASIRKFHAFAWQLSSGAEEMLNTAYLKFNPVRNGELMKIWQVRLDSSISRMPLPVINHRDKNNKEILVQDDKNNLYLLNHEGVNLWKTGLSGKIIGDIHQVDFYGNGKLQYMFNTDDKLYLVDRNGNNVARFPIQLKAKATNGVSVVDYSNKGDFRFFIACDDNKVYVYSREGTIVSGWKFDKTEGTVTHPVRHFSIDGKDYLVFADNIRTYILDRQGVSRFDIERFDHSGNKIFLGYYPAPALVTTDVTGTVRLQHFDGKTATTDLGRFGAGHYFMACDLDGDGNTDYIVADNKRLIAFSDSGKKIFEKKLNSPVTETPSVVDVVDAGRMIGVVCGDESSIYMFDIKGKLHKGFPLQGNTRFAVETLSGDTSSLNIVTGSGNALINYIMEP